METNDPSTPVTPTTPRTPSFPSLPSLLIRTASQRTNHTNQRRNSSIISIPVSPMDTTVPPSPWPQRRESVHEDQMLSSPILDRVPVDTFSREGIKTSLQTPPPRFHLSTLSSPQQYAHAIQRIASPLVPLISVTTGQPHASFPTTLLQYHLLTHPELDDLSVHYHQTSPVSEWSARYPRPVRGWMVPSRRGSGERRGSAQRRSSKPSITLDTKRRRFGRFIGLRGCESPNDSDQQREMEERMEREWQRDLERRREEERMREKKWRGPW